MTTKNVKTILFASLIAAMILPFNTVDFVEAEKSDKKSLVKDKIKEKMKQQSDKDKKEKKPRKNTLLKNMEYHTT